MQLLFTDHNRIALLPLLTALAFWFLCARESLRRVPSFLSEHRSSPKLYMLALPLGALTLASSQLWLTTTWFLEINTGMSLLYGALMVSGLAFLATFVGAAVMAMRFRSDAAWRMACLVVLAVLPAWSCGAHLATLKVHGVLAQKLDGSPGPWKARPGHSADLRTAV